MDARDVGEPVRHAVFETCVLVHCERDKRLFEARQAEQYGIKPSRHSMGGVDMIIEQETVLFFLIGLWICGHVYRAKTMPGQGILQLAPIPSLFFLMVYYLMLMLHVDSFTTNEALRSFMFRFAFGITALTESVVKFSSVIIFLWTQASRRLSSARQSRLPHSS